MFWRGLATNVENNEWGLGCVLGGWRGLATKNALRRPAFSGPIEDMWGLENLTQRFLDKII